MYAQTREESLPLLDARTAFIVAAMSLVFMYLFVARYTDQSGMSHLFFLFAIQVTPILICVARRAFNFLAFILFNHGFSYSIAKYNAIVTFEKTWELQPDTIVAVAELSYCTLLIIIAYTLVRIFLFHRFSVKERYEYLNLTRVQLFVVGCYVGFQSHLIGILPGSIITMHFTLSAAAQVLLFCSKAPGQENMMRFFRLFAVFSTFFYFMKVGSLAMAGSLAGTLFIVGCLQKNTRLLFGVFLCIVSASMLQPIKADYRSMVRTGDYETFYSKIVMLRELLYNKYILGEKPIESDNPDEEIGKEPETTTQMVLKGFGRLGDDSLERVLSWTPSKVPFWNGETYANIPFMFIPRFLWPDKPKWDLWHKFGITYGYLSADDPGTSVGIGYLGEAYMNFGLAGMYTCAILFGIFIAIVERTSFYFLKGHFFFTFICFLIPLLSYAHDIGSIVNSVVIMVSLLACLRGSFLRMAQKDDYST